MRNEKAKWTILTYIAAHNNLERYGRRSWKQIQDVGSTSQVIHGVLYDGPQGATRYICGGAGITFVQEDLKDFDSGDPDRLIETARWFYQQYPAERYGLVLWSHGSGWRPEDIQEIANEVRRDGQIDKAEAYERAESPGSLVLFRSSLARILQTQEAAERAILFDDGSGHSLDTIELYRVTDEIQTMLGQPLDLLGMDACVMATLEVAYQVRHSVKYLVASEEMVPAYSWPYDTIYSHLKANPDELTEHFAASIVDSYLNYYRVGGDVTKVALDLTRIETLAQAVDKFATTLFNEMEKVTDWLWRAQQLARQQEARQNHKQQDTRIPNKFQYDLWDIRSLAARMVGEEISPSVRSASQGVIEALESGGPCILAEGHIGDWFKGIGGVSVYMIPPGKSRLSPYYSQISLSQDKHWAEMLQAYHEYFARL